MHSNIYGPMKVPIKGHRSEIKAYLAGHKACRIRDMSPGEGLSRRKTTYVGVFAHACAHKYLQRHVCMLDIQVKLQALRQ